MRFLQGTAVYFRDEIGARKEENKYISEYFASCLSENSNRDTLRQTFLDLLSIPTGLSIAEENRVAELCEIPLDEPLDIELLESRNYLALVDTFDDPEQIPYAVEVAIEEWFWFELRDTTNEETLGMIRAFAGIWNRTTNAHQTQMTDIFEALITPDLSEDMTRDLVQLFYARLPYPIDREYSPTPMDLDTGIPDSVYDLPSWFQPGLLVVPQKPADSQIDFPPGRENGPLWLRANAVNHLCEGLEWIRSALREINQRYSTRIMQEGAGDEFGRLALESIQDNIDYMLIPYHRSVTAEEIDSQHKKWSLCQTRLEVIKSALFSVERAIRAQENAWRGKPELKLKLAASRYERAKCRVFFRDVMDVCDAEQNRDAAKYRRHECRAIPLEQQIMEDRCIVCMDDIQQVGELDFPPIVTHLCCKKPLHADCLLEWMFNGIRKGNVNCPLCRAKLDADFFAAVLEAKVETMQVL